MLTGWKRRLVSAVIGAAAPALLPFARPALIRILNFHRITYSSPQFALDRDVVSATPELFDRQVGFCKKHFDVISFADLEEAFYGSRPLPGRPLIFTFDDGYEDNYSHAYRILKRHGVTGMFFLAADYIGTDRWFWWDEVAFALNASQGRPVELDVGGERRVFDTRTPESRTESTRMLLRQLKAVPNNARERVIEELAATSRTEYHSSGLPRQIMSWAEAREMAAGGMEIGSHSRSHPILAQVSGESGLAKEIAGSKALIEQHLGRGVSVFSYPVGGRRAINDAVKQVVRNSGYRFAVTYINGLNDMSPHTDPFALNRLHVDGASEREFRMRLVAPHL